MEDKVPYFTVKELAEHLKVSADLIYTLVERKEIPHSRFGRAIRFEKAEIERWKKRQRAVMAS